MLAQHTFKLRRTYALLVLVACSSILAKKHLLITDIRVTALFPVESGHALVTLGPIGSLFTLAKACAVTPVMDRAHLVTVTFYADALIVQLSRGVAVVSQPAVLAVLAPGIVLAAHTGDDVQVVDVTAAVGVAVALTV